MPEPGNPQALNRYSYGDNNPVGYTDPSGHLTRKHIMELFGSEEWINVLNGFEEGGHLRGRWGLLSLLPSLRGPDEWITGMVERAHLYDDRAQRTSCLDDGHPAHNACLAVTVSTGKPGEIWTLDQHPSDGSVRPISLFDAGWQGDIWVAAGSERSHGLLGASPDSYNVSLYPEFVRVGAILDVVALVGGIQGAVVQ